MTVNTPSGERFPKTRDCGKRPAARSPGLSPIESVEVLQVELRGIAYSFSGVGTAGNPAALSDQYSVEARRIAFQRAALAAFGLPNFSTRSSNRRIGQCRNGRTINRTRTRLRVSQNARP